MIDVNKKIILLLPTKIGSNSLKQCFIQSGYEFLKPKNYFGYPIYHSTLSEILSIYDLKKEELDEYKIIQIVRNPFDRFISAWIHQIEIMGRFDIKLKQIIDMIVKNKHLVRYETDKFYESFYGSVSYKDKFFSNNNWGGLRFWWEQNWWSDVDLKNPIKFFKLEEISNSTDKISEFLNHKIVNMPNIRPNMNKKEIFDYSIYKQEFSNSIYDIYKNDYLKYDYKF